MRRYLLVGCVVSAMVLSLSAAYGAPPAKGAAKPAAKKTVVVSFAIEGDYDEGPTSPGVFGDMTPSLATIVRRIDDAAADKDVAAVWLRISDLSIGRAKVYELRGAIARLRKANKPVFAELTTADTLQYLLASSCDRVVMPPSGVLVIPGVRAEITFYKGLLDKLGLQFDVLKMGKYKGAAEPFTRTDMSKPLRESYEALVDDNYQDMLGVIAADRHLKDYQVKTYVDRSLFTAADAKKAGLVDEVLYADQFEDAMKKTLKAEKLDIVTDYKKHKIDADFSGLSGIVKLIEILSGGKPSASVSKKPKIAVVYAVGPIVEGKSGGGGLFDSSVIGSTSMVAAIRKAADDPKVVAVVLRIDSPGGSATASDLIWRETVRLKKPIIASMGDVAGSGGYYIAMGCKKIFAAPGTLTGSIGVIGGKLVTRGLYGKLGLNKEVIARGANSGAMSSNQPFSDGERKVWLELLQDTYHQFVSKAADGRKMKYDKLEELAQGRVYTGVTAKKLGLVDELGTLNDAIAAAKVSAGLKVDADVDLLVLPEPKTIFEQLFGDPSATTDSESVLSEGVRLLRQSKMLRQMLSQRILMWMPYEVEVK
jgi:protease IV